MFSSSGCKCGHSQEKSKEDGSLTNLLYSLHGIPWCLRVILPGLMMFQIQFAEGAFLGTLAPLFRASERPIAIACFRLVTVPALPPRPERRMPSFSRCRARSTLLLAASPYLRPERRRDLEPGLVGIPSSCWLEETSLREVVSRQQHVKGPRFQPRMECKIAEKMA
jgi:hypothetical protein